MENTNVIFNESFKEIQFEFDNATVALYFDNDKYGARFSLVNIENGHVAAGIMCYDYGNIVKILSLVEKHGWNEAIDEIHQIVKNDWKTNGIIGLSKN